MRDTIYSIDTVYIQNKLDSISQLDMGQHINTIHSTYDSNMIVIYWVLGIAFAVFGILIPWLLNKNIDKTETRIQEDSNRNEIRLNREIEHIRNENRHFQESINERIEERINRRVEDFDRLIEEKTRELSAEIMKQKEYLKKLIKITEIHNTGSLYISHNKYSLAISELLKAIELSIREDIYEDFDEMVSNIKFFNEIKAEIDILKVENELGKEINTYINSLVELAKDDTRKKEYLNKILKDINEIFKIEDDK